MAAENDSSAFVDKIGFLGSASLRYGANFKLQRAFLFPVPKPLLCCGVRSTARHAIERGLYFRLRSLSLLRTMMAESVI